MNKNVLYLLITIAAIVVVIMMSKRADTPEAQSIPTEAASPSDVPAAAPEETPPVDDTAVTAPPMDAEGGQDNTTDVDGVPAGAEVTGDAAAPATAPAATEEAPSVPAATEQAPPAAAAPAGTAVPPSEGN